MPRLGGVARAVVGVGAGGRSQASRRGLVVCSGATGGGGFSRDTRASGRGFRGVREKGGIRRGLVVRVPRVAGYLKGGVMN